MTLDHQGTCPSRACNSNLEKNKVLFMSLFDGFMSDLGGGCMDYFVVHGHFYVCMLNIYKNGFLKNVYKLG